MRAYGLAPLLVVHTDIPFSLWPCPRSVLVEIIYRYDGDVIRIAGDALICLFAAPPISPETGRLAPPPSPSRAARRSTLQRVLKCAEACVSAIRAIRTPDIPLDVHVGVGWGSVRCYHVGSDELGWQMVVSGDPLTQVPSTRASHLRMLT